MKQYKCEFANKREPWGPGHKKTICKRLGNCPKGAWCIKPKQRSSYEALKAQNAELLDALQALCTEIAKESGDLDAPYEKARAAIAKAGA